MGSLEVKVVTHELLNLLKTLPKLDLEEQLQIEFDITLKQIKSLLEVAIESITRLQSRNRR